MSTLRSFAEEVLPAINAGLNGLAGVFVVLGLVAIRAGRVARHRGFMAAGVASSILFLACYLLRSALTGVHRFEGPYWLRAFYLAVLMSHMILAVVVVPLVMRTVYLALKNDLGRHRRIARFTYPIWLYVSVTGVLVYVLLYHVSG